MITRKIIQTLLIFFVTLSLSVKAHPSPTPAAGDPLKRIGKPKEGSTSLQQAKIFEVDRTNRILRPWKKINEEFETVLSDVEGIRLECTSDVHPVQWLYFGYGAPTLTSNVTFTRQKGRSGEVSTTEFVATALISPPKEHHTGKYICTPTTAFDTRTFFYIYVPGPTLFNALNGQDILLPKNDTKILIPCTVSNPDVIVTLEKSINEVLQRVKSTAVTYNPKEGMRLDISKLDGPPEGIYVCTARYNNLVRGIEYNVRYPTSQPKVSPELVRPSSLDRNEKQICNLRCGENARCEKDSKGEPNCVCNHLFKGNPVEGCWIDCKSHSDCPQSTVCFSDLKCRDPCVHSIRCGLGASCRVENAYPICFCPENYVGDPRKECINAVQEDASIAPLSSNSSYGNLNQCSKKCGDNGYCTIENGKETCKCNPGLTECNIPCMSHDECPDDLSCNVLLHCHSPCIHNIRCGTNAKCSTINHRPKCYCPRETSGDPMTECFSGFQGDEAPSSSPDAAPSPTPDATEDKCKRDEDCKASEKCMKPGLNKGKMCLNPCKTRRCGIGAQCKTEDQRVFCACMEGFEGNANRECKPIKYEEGVVEPLRRRPSQINCTKPDECGFYSKCTMDKDGKDKCECLEGHIGEPPKCSPECDTNSNCPPNHLCLRDSRLEFPYCSKVCGKKLCGVGSLCREANGVIPPDCECPVGFGGDPYVRCHNLNEKLGQDCNLDLECGSSLRCETGATFRKCVDPCVPLHCSGTANLECAVMDHQASCVCQSGFTGNPSVGCTKDFNITALNESPCGGLSCGPHSECRIDEYGFPSCACRSYARGEPPSCFEECASNNDCHLNLSCIQNQCRYAW